MDFQQITDDFLLYLKIEQNYSDHTIRGYEYDFKVFQQFLTRFHRSSELHDLNPSLVRRFIQDQIANQHVSARTMQRRISSLKSLSRYCLTNNVITSDFMWGIQAPKSDKTLPVYMNMEELKQLFAALERDNHRFALRNEAMFKLLATTGMRRQELVDLTWEQLDFYNETIRIFGKGKKERLLPLHSMVVPILKAYKASLKKYQVYPTEPVFLNKNGKPLNPRGLHMIFKHVLKKAGLPPHRFSLHHLRHTFATLLLQQQVKNQTDSSGFESRTNKDKVDLKTLQELLGHESLATTQVYTHIDFNAKKKAIESFRLD